MVSFSASETLAALLLCASSCPTHRTVPSFGASTQRKKDARPAGPAASDRPAGRKWPRRGGAGEQAQRLSFSGLESPSKRLQQETCVFPADRETSCPSRADTTHFAHPASLGAKNKPVCPEKHSNTSSPQHTLPESPSARDANLSGPGSQAHAASSPGFDYRLGRLPSPLPGLHTTRQPPAASPGRLRRRGSERGPSAPTPAPRSLPRSPGHQARERPLPASARRARTCSLLSCHPSPGSLAWSSLRSEAPRAGRGT